jgi:RsmE family RNA methyltransferase
VNLILLDGADVDAVTLSLPDPRFRHIRDVLRCAVGDPLRVGVANGPLGRATVQTIDRRSVTLTVQWDTVSSPPLLPVHLLVGHPRPPVLRRLIRDVTAMRLASVSVWEATLSERSYFSSSVWDELDRAIDDGLSQGGHTSRPDIRRVGALSAVIETLPETGHRWFGAMRAEGAVTLYSALHRVAADHMAQYIVVGPERGCTEDECATLERAGFHGIYLGDRILRTETAAIMLCGALSTAAH